MVGALERLEELLGLVCERRLERNGIQPSLTLVVANKDVLVVDVWEEGGWFPNFSRCFNDWEVDGTLSLLLVI